MGTGRQPIRLLDGCRRRRPQHSHSAPMYRTFAPVGSNRTARPKGIGPARLGPRLASRDHADSVASGVLSPVPGRGGENPTR